MYKKLTVCVAVPAYNEELLIKKTIDSIPKFVDAIIVVNDGSKDNTLKIIKQLKKHEPRLTVINNEKNLGIGASLTKALKKSAELGYDLTTIMAGDAQMDPKLLPMMIDSLKERNLDFIKANRFMHLEELKSMPTYRRIGNIVVTLLTKFSTGYYGIFDTQNGYVVYTKKVLQDLPWHVVGDRYEFENTILIALSIINARIGDFSAPAIYGEEKSTIRVFSATMRVLMVLYKGFWQRIYYKYVLYNFHPIAVFLFGATLSGGIGILGAIYLVLAKLFYDISPTSGSVMLVVLPIIISFQLALTAFMLDVMEDKNQERQP